MRVKSILEIALSLTLTSCVTMHESALQIKSVPTNRDLPSGCEDLGDVDSFSMWGEEPAMAYLRNDAADLGATHMILKDQLHTFWGISYQAEVYQCRL